MYPASLLLKGKANLSGSDAQMKLAELVLEEDIQVISSFELNQIASLTYGEMVCDEVFEFLEEILSHKLDHSPLALQKALIITKHVVIYGSEKTVNSAWALGRYINELREYNTILLAQQRQGPEAFWNRIKGGGVDKGFPVREAAEELNTLLQSKEHIQMMRHTKADPNSLVPVGDDKIAFASDEVRHYLLKKRIQEQSLMHTKSNLKKERGGFGSGFQSKDGKQVVGAAHSLEEMMARANREKQKFSDNGPVGGSQQQQQTQGDLLSYEQPVSTQQQEVDLLDFSSPSEPVAPASTDLLGTSDLLGATMSTNSQLPAANATSASLDATTDLLSLMTVAAPAAPQSTDTQSTSTAAHDAFAPVVPALETEPRQETGNAEMNKMPAMSANEDRFAALDALANGNTSGSILTGLEAQNRILGSFSANEVSQTSNETQQTDAVGVVTCMQNPNHHPMNSLSSEPLSMSNGLSGLSTVMPPPMEDYVQPNLAGISMGATYGDPTVGDDDDDDGFVMGGVAGSGLEPSAPPPVGAPPPPPPAMY